MRITFKADKGQFLKATSEYERIIAHAATSAVREVGILGRDAARLDIDAAGFGTAWQKSIVSSMHPKRGDVLNPWAWIHSRINFSDVFETGKTIEGNLLWIPLPNAPAYPGAIPPRQITPHKYVTIFGPNSIRTIRRPGRTPMLGAVVRAGPSGKPTRKIKGGVLGSRGRIKVIPMWVGVPAVTLRKRFNIKEAVDAQAEKMAGLYAHNLEKYEGR